MESSKSESGQTAPAPLPWQAHIMCGWPLILVFIGGAIGGGLGGRAYGINIKVYKSGLPAVAKSALNILTGVAAFVVWIIIVRIIRGYGV
ncbi:MAG: hypothetical protein FWC42_09740 [Proteobacteria bacterium]|nr:hypothetical protein [Pseudomonadota bacterium]